MKITKEQLKQIIKEELTEVQGKEFVDEYVERIRNALEGHQKRPEVMKMVTALANAAKKE